MAIILIVFNIILTRRNHRKSMLFLHIDIAIRDMVHIIIHTRINVYKMF